MNILVKTIPIPHASSCIGNLLWHQFLSVQRKRFKNPHPIKSVAVSYMQLATHGGYKLSFFGFVTLDAKHKAIYSLAAYAKDLLRDNKSQKQFQPFAPWPYATATARGALMVQSTPRLARSIELNLALQAYTSRTPRTTLKAPVASLYLYSVQTRTSETRRCSQPLFPTKRKHNTSRTYNYTYVRGVHARSVCYAKEIESGWGR